MFVLTLLVSNTAALAFTVVLENNKVCELVAMFDTGACADVLESRSVR